MSWRSGSSNNNAPTLPPVSPSIALDDRRARQDWIQQQLEDRKRRYDKQLNEKQLELQQLHDRQWSPYLRDAARTHELNIAWKQERGFFSWERVLEIEELEALRITGHTVPVLPPQLPQRFSTLTTLSLIACQLEVLPDTIGNLQALTELDLTKNSLRSLPESITTLTQLRHLQLSSNQLEKLPQGFGSLVNLDKLWLEDNRLRSLPDSISSLKVHTINANNNRLKCLPDSLGDLTSLRHFSINMNLLTEFPDAVAKLVDLESLHASRNLLTSLPRNIGNLVALRDLRLDWNQISELPFSFRLLRSLETLLMERNPLKLPPIEYVTRGVRPIMLYIQRSLEEFIRKARRQVVEHVLATLSFAATLVASLHAKPQPLEDAQDKSDLEILDAHFEPNVQRKVKQTELLPFFGIVWDAFYSQLMPILERRSPTPLPLLTLCTADEIEDALLHYDDFFGPASMEDKHCEFRRCACIDTELLAAEGVTKRRVCVPGQVPYRCRRAARLVRMTMMTTEEAKDQLASTYLKTKIARLVAKTKAKCVAYINSEEGVVHFESLATAMAKKHCVRRKNVKKLRLQLAKTTAKLAKKRAGLVAKVDAFRKARDARLQSVTSKLDKLKAERTAVADGDVKKVKRLEEKIRGLEAELAEEPLEDKKMLEVELAIEAVDNALAEAQRSFENGKAKDMDDGDPVAAEEEDEGEGSGGDDGDEDDEDGSEPEEDDDGDGDSSDDEEEEEEEGGQGEAPAGEAPRSFFTVEMPEMHVDDYRRVATHTIEDSLGEDRVVNEEELVVLYQQQLRDAYVAEKCALVEKKATYEFLQMRAVLKRWMGHGSRAVFEAWRDVVRANRTNAELVKEKKARKQRIEEENRILAEELKRVEAKKWVQRVDMYTDAVYYEHTETGETSWTPPTYWDEEQPAPSVVPLLKLPPI